MSESLEKGWYALHVKVGFERHAREQLRERIDRYGMCDSFGEILLPMEKSVEIKKGKKQESEEKMFPGYLFIEMAMEPECFHLVKSTPKINGFIGGSSGGDLPRSLSAQEMAVIRNRIEIGASKPVMRSKFSVGEQVRIKDGPFSDFNGLVENVNSERERLSVSVMVFGRSTPVELDFVQVEKV